MEWTPLSQLQGRFAVALGLSVTAHVLVLLATTFFVTNPESPTALPEEAVALLFQAPAPHATVPEPAKPPEPELVATQIPIVEPTPVAQPTQPAVQDEPPQTSAVRVPPPVSLPVPKQIAQAAPVEKHAREPSQPQPTAVAAAMPVAPVPVVPPRPVAGMETNRAPSYPEIARRRGEQGRVMLRVSVGPDGTPLEVDVQNTSGYPILDSAALNAVRQWRFIPAMQAGAPVRAVAEVPIRFQLEN